MSSVVDVLFRDYVDSLRVSASSVSVVTIRLQKAAPTDMSTDEKKALKVVVQRADDVAEVLAERDRQAPAKVRPLLIAFVADWTSFANALAARARVSKSATNPAQDLYASLFPDGMDFAQTDAETAWSEGHRLLERIEKEELTSTIDSMLGQEFLAAVTASTEALGNAIGTGSSDRTTPSSTALSEALFRFGRAVGRYGRVIAASCDEDDEASVQRFIRAVAPIDTHRSSMRGSERPSTTAADDTATEPTTAPPAHPTSTGTSAPVTSTSNGSTPAPVVPSTSNGATLAPLTGSTVGSA